MDDAVSKGHTKELKLHRICNDDAIRSSRSSGTHMKGVNFQRLGQICRLTKTCRYSLLADKNRGQLELTLTVVFRSQDVLYSWYTPFQTSGLQMKGHHFDIKSTWRLSMFRPGWLPRWLLLVLLVLLAMCDFCALRCS